MGLINDMKNQIKRSGASKGKIVYFKAGNKVRIRFLHELDDGMKALFHDSFEAGINHPCQELYDRECPNHDDESLRHRDLYIWSVWDYEAKEVKLLLGAVNSFSPIPQFLAFYDTYGTICDRDYVVTRNGTGTSTTYSVVPMDKVKFKNKAAKPFSESGVLKLLDKAYPCEDNEDEDEPKRKRKKGEKAKGKRKSRIEEEDEDDEDIDVEDDFDEDEEDEDEADYSEMSVKELYKECKRRDLDVEPKKSAKYYIKQLEADDAEADDEDEDEDDDW